MSSIRFHFLWDKIPTDKPYHLIHNLVGQFDIAVSWNGPLF